jgi:hypothetical protein
MVSPFLPNLRRHHPPTRSECRFDSCGAAVGPSRVGPSSERGGTCARSGGDWASALSRAAGPPPEAIGIAGLLLVALLPLVFLSSLSSSLLAQDDGASGVEPELSDGAVSDGSEHDDSVPAVDPPLAAPERVPPERPTLDGPGVVLLSGELIAGELRRSGADTLEIEGRDAPIPLYEIQEIRLAPAGEASGAEAGAPNANPGAAETTKFASAFVRFRSGESFGARIVRVENERALLRADDFPELSLPIESIAAFSLREPHPSDNSFSDAIDAIAAAPPKSDALFARQGNNLLRVEGVFRGLTEEHLLLERQHRVGRMLRRLVHGMILAPTATARREADPPSHFEYSGLGQLPAYLRSISPDGIEVRFPGAPETETTILPRKGLTRILFASDRVVFLSTLEPQKVEETPVVGKGLGYRKDRSLSGDAIRLGGKPYRRGLSVRSKTRLDYAVSGQYRAFAAVIGLDDATHGKGGVTFRVLADGKEIFSKNLIATDTPAAISIPLEGVELLGLEVDYGPDGSDVADWANWASARVTR